MANSTVLQLVQSFCREYGQPAPGALQGSSDSGALQMRELLQTVGEYAWSIANWSQCVRQGSWTSVAGASQGALTTLFPLNFEAIIRDTLWDGTVRRGMKGPMSLSSWQAASQLSSGFPPYSFTVVNGSLVTSTAMPAGHAMSCYYKTKNWIVSGGSEAMVWTTDSDTSVFSDRLMKAGLKAFWLRIKQMPHQFEMEAFEDITLQEASSQAFQLPLSMDQDQSGAFGIMIPNWNAIP